MTPLRRTVELHNRAADGDLTSRLEVSTNDEVGQAGTALNKMLERTSEVVRAIGGNAGSLATSSDELSAVAQQLGASAEETSAQSTTASAAPAQVSAKIGRASGRERVGQYV